MSNETGQSERRYASTQTVSASQSDRNVSESIQLILSDVDGVLTDGRIIYDNAGVETKVFHVRDGVGIKLWQKSGFAFGIVTSRNSQVVRVRAQSWV